ncbi:hypothetical protein PE36_00140 [Moritella sp. PE36]|uniref:hypothetical protein n=1 Tax=Moritella sp. PE36 TaxID=58051 RepID=UPI000156927D|nr:hypothetical protein [Moritella sp. PE36]EDM66159.1 hypothetical protein PE36_00140 [Moritella sp. PE36]
MNKDELMQEIIEHNNRLIERIAELNKRNKSDRKLYISCVLIITIVYGISRSML